MQTTTGISGHALPVNISAASIEHDMGESVLYYRSEMEVGRERPAQTVNARTDTRVITTRPGSEG